MNDILSLTWESMKNPGMVGLFVTVLMALFVKKLIHMAFVALWDRKNPGIEMPEDLPVRSLAVNVVTYLLCFFVTWAYQKSACEWPGWGAVWVSSTVATVISIGAYETTKNILGSIGVKP